MTNKINQSRMTTQNNTTFIHTPAGVNIIYDKSARQFIPNSHFDADRINAILGLDKPKARIKALTGVWNSKQNCHVVRYPKINCA